MKFKSSFELRDVCGEYVLIATGIENINFSSLINLNETAADIYKHFADKEFEIAEVYDFVESTYEGATRKQIENDINTLFEKFRESGVVA